ncbi:MAG TPA: helix-turn-helix transcriptional regulator, partial [Candidatus Limnocylindrales bacterium]
AEVDEIDDQEPYSAGLLARLRDLVPSAVVLYQEVDLGARRFGRVLSDDPGGEDADIDDQALYWTLGPCPITDYRIRTSDLTAIRMSDVIGRARWHELAIYRDYYRPYDVESFLDLGLAAGRDWHRSVVLMRERGDADYSERDRSVLEALRPHLRAREARAALRDALQNAPLGAALPAAAPEPNLTAREREIVALVAAGRTNAEIAGALWVAPGTVKKHLENVYVKLGVGSRAAAASRLREQFSVS